MASRSNAASTLSNRRSAASSSGVLDRVAGGELVAVRRAAHVLGVEVHEDLRHPAEERGLLQVVVDPLDDRRERAVHELLGVALVGAQAPREREKPGAVFRLEPFRAAFAVLAEFFDDGHGSRARMHPTSSSYRIGAFWFKWVPTAGRETVYASPCAASASWPGVEGCVPVCVEDCVSNET